jgi:flagellar biosynthetic protein FliR
LIRASLLAYLLIFIRTATFLAFVPIFTRGRVPQMVKIGLAVSLSVMWFQDLSQDKWHIPLPQIANAHGLALAITILFELAFGAAVGFLFSMFVEPVRIAGAYIGQEIGLTMATIADPSNPTSTNVISSLLEAILVLAILGLNLHHYAFGLLYLSFDAWPVGSTLAPVPLGWLTQQLSEAQDQGLLIAAPIGVILFFLTVCLGILSRVSPQLNFFAIGMPLRVAVGLICLLICTPAVIHTALRLIRVTLEHWM